MAVALVCAVMLFGGTAAAQIGPTVQSRCDASGGPGQECRGPEHLATLAATECRLLASTAEAADNCDEIDGRTTNERQRSLVRTPNDRQAAGEPATVIR